MKPTTPSLIKGSRICLVADGTTVTPIPDSTQGMAYVPLGPLIYDFNTFPSNPFTGSVFKAPQTGFYRFNAHAQAQRLIDFRLCLSDDSNSIIYQDARVAPLDPVGNPAATIHAGLTKILFLNEGDTVTISQVQFASSVAQTWPYADSVFVEAEFLGQ